MSARHRATRSAVSPHVRLTGAIALLAASILGLGASLSGAAGGPGEPPPAIDVRIDINTATAAELSLLPRIGPTLSERIVGDRTRRGPFSTVADLDRVHGIGPRTVMQVEPYATAGEPRAAPPAP